MDNERIMQYALAIGPELVRLRRQIHRNPELAIQEFETAKLVAKTLRELGIKACEGVGKTGVVGLLQNTVEGKTVALRADMDALPIAEENTHTYRSIHPHIMHACGHDVHTAALLGAAKILAQEKDSVPGNVKFIFQPSEESPLGGAAEMIREGVLESPKVTAIVGLHVDPNLTAGTIGYREGPFYAIGAGFQITIIGKSGHGALPHQAVDAILISAEVIQALQSIASSQIDPIEPFVLTIGTVYGGTQANIIADQVSLTGTVRCFDEQIIQETGVLIEKIVKHITEAYGGTYKLEYVSGLKPLWNDRQVTAAVKKAAEKIAGTANVVEVPRVLLGEDFASYSHAIPAAFMSLGVGFADRKNFPLHNPRFDIDEQALPLGAALYASAALELLNSTKVRDQNGTII